MNCFCAREFGKVYHKVADIEFEDGEKYCSQWLYDFAKFNIISIVSNLIVVLVNMIA